MSRGTGLRALSSQQTKSRFEHLETRQLMSTSLDIGTKHFEAVSDSFNSTDLVMTDAATGNTAVVLQHWNYRNAVGSIFEFNGKAIFTAGELYPESSSPELWSSDGTVGGTGEIAYSSGHTGIQPHDFHVINGQLVFLAKQYGYNLKVFGTDGTFDGTHVLIGTRTPGVVSNVNWTTTSVEATETVGGDYGKRFASDGTVDGTRLRYNLPSRGFVRLGFGSDSDQPGSLRIAPSSLGDGILDVTSNGVTNSYDGRDAEVVIDTFLAAPGSNITIDPALTRRFVFVVGSGNFAIHANQADNVIVYKWGHEELIKVGDNGITSVGSSGETLTGTGRFSYIVGSDTADTIIGSSRAETLIGGRGNDSIVGNGGGDTLGGDTTAFANLIDGGSGDISGYPDEADTLVGDVGVDTINALANDTVVDSDPYSPASDDHSGEPTTPTPAINARVSSGILRVYGTSGDDAIQIRENAGNRSLTVTINEISKDFPKSGISTVIVFAGAGDDVINFRDTPLKSRLYGEAGNDTIYGGSGKDRVYGGDGDDWIGGFDNHDTLYGDAGNDKLFGDGGHDYLVGGTGVNVLRGGVGVDHVIFAESDDYRSNIGDKLTIDSILG